MQTSLFYFYSNRICTSTKLGPFVLYVSTTPNTLEKISGEAGHLTELRRLLRFIDRMNYLTSILQRLYPHIGAESSEYPPAALRKYILTGSPCLSAALVTSSCATSSIYSSNQVTCTTCRGELTAFCSDDTDSKRLKTMFSISFPRTTCYSNPSYL